jgi:hypothetical protein
MIYIARKPPLSNYKLMQNGVTGPWVVVQSLSDEH